MKGGMNGFGKVLVHAFFEVLLGFCICGGCANTKYDVGCDLDTFGAAVYVNGVPLVAQSKKYQCGYACLAGVAMYYGAPPEKLIETALVEAYSGKPLSAKELVAMAKRLGMIGFAYEGGIDDLIANLKKGRPVIVLLNDPPRTGGWPSIEWAHDTAESFSMISHWVVVTGLTPTGEFVLQDPRKGRLLMRADALATEWERKSWVSVLIGARSSS